MRLAFGAAALLAALALASCERRESEPARTAAAAPQVRTLGPWLASEAAADRFSGAVLVARGDEVLFRGAYGLADRGTGEPLTPESRFRIASLSKQFTAAAVLQLQDKGVLSVDDPVCRWIEPCPEAWRAVTLHHLLSHTSGVPDLMRRRDWSKVRWAKQSTAEMTAASAALPLEFQPGERIGYSNVGYNLLGHVVERAAARPFAEHLRLTLLEPLGLKDTGWDDGSRLLATGYSAGAEGLIPRRESGADVVFASGALYSTVDDLFRWNRALHRGRVLSAKSYAQMTAAAAPERYVTRERLGVPQTFGYGVFIGPRGMRMTPGFPERQVFHTGSWSGFRALATYQPDADVTVVVLSNNYEQEREVLLVAQRAMAEALGRPLPVGLAPAPPIPEGPAR